MSTPTELDRDRIERLTGQILTAIQANYIQGPVSRDRCYEALNALAFSTALVVRGTGDAEALEWFSQALNTSLKAIEIDGNNAK